MIEFQRLRFKNFLSFRSKQEVQLSNQGIVQIEGRNEDEGDSNRAGKSAVLESLIWCLFGRTIRGLKHDAVVNRFSTKQGCWAEVLFTANGISYRVVRYRSHSKHRNNLRLFIDQREHSFRHAEETQAKIESILGCDFNSFANSVVFGGTKPFASLTDAEQKKVLESFLHFELLDKALQRTREQLAQTNSKLQDKQQRKAKLAGSLASIKSGMQALQRSERAWRKKHNKERRHIARQLASLEMEPAPRDYSKKIGKKEGIHYNTETKLRRLEREESVLSDRLESLRGLIANRERQVGKTCDACGQEVSEKFAEKALSELRKDLEYKDFEHNECTKRVSKYRKEEAAARQALDRLQMKQQKTNRLIIQRGQLRKGFLSQLSKTDRQGGVPFAAEIKEQQARQSRYLSKLLVVEQEIENLEQYVADLEFWVIGFGNQGIKALVVRQALPAMNAKLAEFASEVFGEAAELRFSPVKTNKSGNEKELFNLDYKSRYGAESYVGESAGGRKRVDICVLLVFSWLGRICNLLLIDELLDGLDESGREAVLRILGTLRGTVLVISHQRELKSKFSSRWIVTKRDGESKLEVA